MYSCQSTSNSKWGTQGQQNFQNPKVDIISYVAPHLTCRAVICLNIILQASSISTQICAYSIPCWQFLVNCCKNEKQRLCCRKLLALIQTHRVKQQSPQQNCSPLWDIQSQQHGGTKKCQQLQILMQGFVGKFFSACTWLVYQVSNTRWQNQLHNPQSTIRQYKMCSRDAAHNFQYGPHMTTTLSQNSMHPSPSDTVPHSHKENKLQSKCLWISVSVQSLSEM